MCLKCMKCKKSRLFAFVGPSPVTGSNIVIKELNVDENNLDFSNKSSTNNVWWIGTSWACKHVRLPV